MIARLAYLTAPRWPFVSTVQTAFPKLPARRTQMQEATIGHNSAADEPVTKIAKDQLRAIIERVERMEEEKKAIADDIRDIYVEAKGNGMDVKALRTIVRMRKQDANERAEQDAILELYMQAMGML